MFITANYMLGDLVLRRDKLDRDKFLVIYKGVQVGYIYKQTYVTRRNFKQHYFRKFSGYGISRSIILLLLHCKVDKIIIIEEKDGRERLLISEVKDWLNKGLSYEFRLPDGEKDGQLVLPVEYMQVKE